MKNLKRKPTHIAIIMDGNGRWGETRRENRSYGHFNAKEAVKEAMLGCLEEGIIYLTLYAFSTENWSRPLEEIDTIFRVIACSIAENLKFFVEHNIKFRVIGDPKGIPVFCWNQIEEAIAITKNNTQLNLTIAINYGGRAETLAASESMVNDYLLKAVDTFLDRGSNRNASFADFIQFIQDYRVKVTSDVYEKYLYTNDLPNVDLIIRTGGKKRISNFFPWQSTYAELYFTDLLWPTFKKKDLIKALTFFQQQDRTFGKACAL